MTIASEITALNTNLTAAKNAVTAKGGTVGDTGLAGLAAEIAGIPAGGGDVVNSTIFQFKAGDNDIAPNTFVNVNSNMTTSELFDLSDVNNSYEYSRGVYIGNNKAFVTYRNGSVLYAQIITVNGGTITPGTGVQVSGLGYQYVELCRLGTNKIFITLRPDKLYGIVCEFDENDNITAGTATTLNNTTPSIYDQRYSPVVALDDERVFVFYRNDTTVDGMVCSVSGTTITRGTPQTVATAENNVRLAATLVDTDKILTIHCNDDSTTKRMCGTLCSITDDEITPGNTIELSHTDSSGQYASAVTLETNKVFILHSIDTSGLYGIVCDINGSTITIGYETRLLYHLYNRGLWKMDSETLFLLSNSTPSSLSGSILKVKDNAIAYAISVTLSNGSNTGIYPYAIYLGDNKFVGLRRKSYSDAYLSSNIITIGDVTVTPSGQGSDTYSNRAITKTACSTSATGDVWVLTS